MDVLSVLKEKRNIIWPEFQKYLKTQGRDFFWQMIRDYPLRGGKYLRGSLILLSCEAFGGDPTKAVRTAVAMEASQNWLLIHDDIQDHSEERRGKPCLHQIHGIEQALNAGDALHVLMWKILIDNEDILGPQLTLRILNEFYKMLIKTAEGQALEMWWTNKPELDIQESDYYTIIDTKAGWYTIAYPMRLGAIIAHADESKLPLLNELAKPLGRAFQIQDDVLNLIGDPIKYGKEVGGDILEGKRTLMLIHLIKHCTAAELQKLENIYKKKREQKNADDVRYVIELMKEYGSIEYAKCKAGEFASEAKNIFKQKFTFLPESSAKRALDALIDFIVNREL